MSAWRGLELTRLSAWTAARVDLSGRPAGRLAAGWRAGWSAGWSRGRIGAGLAVGWRF